MKQFAHLAGYIVFALVLSACGGGGGGDAGNVQTPASSQAPTSTSLQALPVPINTYCGYSVGATLVSGTVISVHDGDTVKISTLSGVRDIRLEGIDAPELAQPYGPQSQANLSALVLNKPVTVAYSKLDQYGRVVGTVFTSSCQLANLTQLHAGAAWFYKAYQCEQTASLRSLYAVAQTTASESRLGLWAATDPEAPWYFRNGREPATPVCTSDLPDISDTAQSTPVQTVTPPPVTPTPTTPTVVPATTPPVTPITTTTSTPTDRICYVGPRGGTYTLTANGNKNYGGC